MATIENVTSVRLTKSVRDRLAQVSSRDFGGSSMSDTIDQLIEEHEEARLKGEILAGYRRLQADPEAWADYLAELNEWDGVAGDGLVDHAA